MNVSLTPELAELVRGKVQSGLYPSESEVVRQALRLLEARDRLQEQSLQELKAFIAVGIEQADRGEVAPLDLDATFARVRARNARTHEGG